MPTRASKAALLLDVPIRSQLDGTPYERANCGPATLGMVLDAYGIHISTPDLRDIVNMLQNSYGFDDGTSWEALARIARDYGLEVKDLAPGGYYRLWSLDRIEEHLLAGHPVILLTRYNYLPGNWSSAYEGDHYIVITGLAEGKVIYNDSAFFGEDGYSLIMDVDVLIQAWSTARPAMTAMALAPIGDGPVVPRLLDRVKEQLVREGLLSLGRPAVLEERGDGKGATLASGISPDVLQAQETDGDHPIARMRPVEGVGSEQERLVVPGLEIPDRWMDDGSELLEDDQWRMVGFDSQIWEEGNRGTAFPFKREVPVAVVLVLLIVEVVPAGIRFFL